MVSPCKNQIFIQTRPIASGIGFKAKRVKALQPWVESYCRIRLNPAWFVLFRLGVLLEQRKDEPLNDPGISTLKADYAPRRESHEISSSFLQLLRL
jgi:hypothetical protein